jgi:hypothetical protein
MFFASLECMNLSGETKCTLSHDAHRGRRGARTGPEACRRKFLRFFPKGFQDPKYVDWERAYKWAAHERWEAELNQREFRGLIKRNAYEEIGRRAVAIEARTNLLFSFEKMALRDAIRAQGGAEMFSMGLYELLHGRAGNDEKRFARWIAAVKNLPRKQTRVLTWPIVTVFGFIAEPDRHMFLKPNVTRVAAAAYGFNFVYRSSPDFETYSCLLRFAAQVGKDQRALSPRDMIDLQSFIWVQGSDEYEE